MQFIRIEQQTVRRITNDILGAKGLTSTAAKFSTVFVTYQLSCRHCRNKEENHTKTNEVSYVCIITCSTAIFELRIKKIKINRIQDRFSPHNIRTISSRQVMRLQKNINCQILRSTCSIKIIEQQKVNGITNKILRLEGFSNKKSFFSQNLFFFF